MRRGSLKGYSGSINRVIKIKGERMEYFISGSPDMTFEEALRDNWPFEERDSKSKFRLVTPSGEDITKNALSSHEGTVLVEFIS
ncbi:MAG: hypothetical protein E4H14_11205 [Candidatus Thorarchaeota archaeon]|jgi:hypothetical protein|nr:MAG: hypothetical protein E4H14_11205 [Candidatus Thorarchaeota archaeon]